MFKKGDRVQVTCYATPRYATILRKCHRAPRKWVVVFEGTGFVEAVKEENLRKA